MQTESIFGGFKSERPVVNLLPVGDSVAEIVRTFVTDSGTNANGSAKDRSDKPYVDSCPQYGVVLKGKGEKGGVMTVRFQGMGYYRTSDFDPADLAERGLVDGDGYAMVKNDAGDYVRIQHEGRTEDCKNILNQFCDALGLPEGSGLEAVVPGLTVGVTVTEEDYDGNPQRRVKRWRKVEAEVTADLA